MATAGGQRFRECLLQLGISATWISDETLPPKVIEMENQAPEDEFSLLSELAIFTLPRLLENE